MTRVALVASGGWSGRERTWEEGKRVVVSTCGGQDVDVSGAAAGCVIGVADSVGPAPCPPRADGPCGCRSRRLRAVTGTGRRRRRRAQFSIVNSIRETFFRETSKDQIHRVQHR